MRKKEEFEIYTKQAKFYEKFIALKTHNEAENYGNFFLFFYPVFIPEATADRMAKITHHSNDLRTKLLCLRIRGNFSMGSVFISHRIKASYGMDDESGRTVPEEAQCAYFTQCSAAPISASEIISSEQVLWRQEVFSKEIELLRNKKDLSHQNGLFQLRHFWKPTTCCVQEGELAQNVYLVFSCLRISSQ